MKRYRFRLASVLKVRRVTEDQAKGRLAEAQRIVADAESSVEARRAAYQALEPLRRAQTARQFHEEIELRRSVALSLLAARNALDDARDAAELRRRELVEARQDVEALERMEERERAIFEMELRRAEELVVDDIVTSRFERSGPPEGVSP